MYLFIFGFPCSIVIYVIVANNPLFFCGISFARFLCISDTIFLHSSFFSEKGIILAQSGGLWENRTERQSAPCVSSSSVPASGRGVVPRVHRSPWRWAFCGPGQKPCVATLWHHTLQSPSALGPLTCPLGLRVAAFQGCQAARSPWSHRHSWGCAVNTQGGQETPRKTGHQQPTPSWGLQGRAGHQERARGASPALGFQGHPGPGPPTVVAIGAAGHWSAMSGQWSRASLCCFSLAPGSPVLGHPIEGPGVPGGAASTCTLCPPGRHRGGPRLERSSKCPGQVLLGRVKTTGQERPCPRRGRHGHGAEAGMAME